MSYSRMTEGPRSWKSGRNTIQASNTHPGLFIVNYPDNTFAPVNSTHELMLAKYPINKHHHNGKTKR